MYDTNYQPPLVSILRHRYNSNPSLFVEATMYAIIIGFIVYIFLQITSHQTLFYTLIFIIFIYFMFTSNNKKITQFYKKVKYVAKNQL